MSAHEVIFPWPPKELSPNARTHYMALARVKKQYRQTCCYLAMEAGIKSPDGTNRLHVDLLFYPPNRRSRDEDNMFASMKAGLDGLADAMGIDDRRFKTTFDVSTEIGGMVKVTIRALES